MRAGGEEGSSANRALLEIVFSATSLSESEASLIHRPVQGSLLWQVATGLPQRRERPRRRARTRRNRGLLASPTRLHLARDVQDTFQRSRCSSYERTMGHNRTPAREGESVHPYGPLSVLIVIDSRAALRRFLLQTCKQVVRSIVVRRKRIKREERSLESEARRDGDRKSVCRERVS